MDNEQLDEIMKRSKEAIVRAYMCRETFEEEQECPKRGIDGMCVVGGHCWTVTPQRWEKVLNSAQEPKK